MSVELSVAIVIGGIVLAVWINTIQINRRRDQARLERRRERGGLV